MYWDFGSDQVTGKDFVDVATGMEDDESEARIPILGNLPSLYSSACRELLVRVQIRR